MTSWWRIPSWVVCGIASLIILYCLSIPLAFFHTSAGRNSYAITVSILSVLAYGMVVYVVTTREVRLGRNIAHLIGESAAGVQSGSAARYRRGGGASSTFPDSSFASSRLSVSRRPLDSSLNIRRRQSQRRRRVNRPDYPESDGSEDEHISALRKEVVHIVNDETNCDRVLQVAGLESRCVSSEMEKLIYGLRLVGREAVLLGRYLRMIQSVARKGAALSQGFTRSSAARNQHGSSTSPATTPAPLSSGTASPPSSQQLDAFPTPNNENLPFGGDDGQPHQTEFEVDQPPYLEEGDYNGGDSDRHDSEDGSSSSTSFASLFDTPVNR